MAEKTLVPIDDAAEFFGVTRATIYHHIRRHNLEIKQMRVKVLVEQERRKWFVNLDDLKKYVVGSGNRRKEDN